MPTYVYKVILPDGEEGQIFEVQQKMSDPPLTEHPTNGMPCKRVITAPHLGIEYTEQGAKRRLGRESLEKKGFSRYEKDSNGSYYKTAGTGPDLVDRNTLA